MLLVECVCVSEGEYKKEKGKASCLLSEMLTV